MRAEHFFLFHQQQNLERRFDTSKMHLNLQWLRLVSVLLLLIVTPIVGFCNCSMFCCALLYVHSSFAIYYNYLDGLLCLVCLPGVS